MMDESTIPLVIQSSSSRSDAETTSTSPHTINNSSSSRNINMNNNLVDMSAHTGLRGAAAVWIMLFHCSIYSTLGIDWQGSSIMPLFFLLSGFSLTVAYCKQPRVDSQMYYLQFDENNFYWNRLSRVIPVYYVGLLFSLPLCFAGFNNQNPTDYVSIVLSTIVSFIPVDTLFCFVLGGALDGPGWTIGTLVFMWWWFPSCLRYLCTLTDKELVAKISVYYWIQLVMVFVLFFGFVSQVGFWVAFSAATMNPLSRMPVFAMGMCGALLCMRHPMRNRSTGSGDNATGGSDSVEGGHLVPDASTTAPASSAGSAKMPWNQAYLTFFPSTSVRAPRVAQAVPVRYSSHSPGTQSAQYELVTRYSDDNGEKAQYGPEPFVNLVHISTLRHTDLRSNQHQSTDSPLQIKQAEAEEYRQSSVNLSISLLSLTLLFALLDYANQRLGGGSILGFVWFQAILPFAQLTLIVSLCRDHGTSSAYKVLTTKAAAWLGERSMCIYLLHWPLIYYVCWAVHGSALEWPAVSDCSGITDESSQAECYERLYRWSEARVMPLWGIPVVSALTLVLSECVYRVVESPTRRYMKR